MTVPREKYVRVIWAFVAVVAVAFVVVGVLAGALIVTNLRLTDTKTSLRDTNTVVESNKKLIRALRSKVESQTTQRRISRRELCNELNIVKGVDRKRFEESADDAEAFLLAHPNGTADITPDLILRSIVRNRATAKQLADVDCDVFAKTGSIQPKPKKDAP